MSEHRDMVQEELVASQAREAELKEELVVMDELLAEQYRLIDSIPDCEVHGNRCVPHAIEWVNSAIQREAEMQKVLADRMLNTVSLEQHRKAVALLEAAEARIKASQEQKPYGYLYMELGRDVPEFHYKKSSHDGMVDVWTKPTILPEISELQRENEVAKNVKDEAVRRADFYMREADTLRPQVNNLLRENAELRKLLEKKEKD